MCKKLVFLLFFAVSANAFAGPDDLFLPNTVIANGCVVPSTGGYAPTIRMTAVYRDVVVSVYNCDPGYYLPLAATECAICDTDSFCPGGEYSFSETQNGGITPCPNNLVSPKGTATAGGCGKILHVGDDIIYLTQEKQTAPALAVRINGSVFYAKTSSGAKPMHENTHKVLRLKINGVEYSIHDNTIKGE